MEINLIKGKPELLRKDSPAIVFIHGAWHGAWCWQEHFIPFFTKNGYECYAFDLPNHGENKDLAGINQYRIADYINHLELVLAQINKHVVLIGHSLGGYIVQKYLEKKDCQAAILVASVPCKPIWRLFFKLCFHQPIAMFKMIMTLDLFHIVNTTSKATQLLFSAELTEEERERFTQKLGSESFKMMTLDLLFSRINRRKNLAIPLLVQCAGKDNVVSISENKYTRRFQKADYQFFKEMAHDVMIDPKWMLSANSILNWLNKQFPESVIAEPTNLKNPKLKIQFPDAVQDLITNLGENNEIDADKSKILGLGKSKRDN